MSGCFWQDEVKSQERGCGASSLAAEWASETATAARSYPNNAAGYGYMDVTISGGTPPYSVSVLNFPGRTDLSLITVSSSMVSSNVARVTFNTAIPDIFAIQLLDGCAALFVVRITDAASAFVEVAAPVTGLTWPTFRVFNPYGAETPQGTGQNSGTSGLPSGYQFGLAGGCN